MNKRYSSSGDLGDCIYSLAALRHLGPCDLVLPPTKDFARDSWTPEKVERCQSFFLQQPYIQSVRFGDKEGIDMDIWRRAKFLIHNDKQRSILEAHQQALDVPYDYSPWLVVDKVNSVAPLVVNRTFRYRQHEDLWHKTKSYFKNAVFVGFEDEWQDFKLEFGEIDYYPTPTLLDLARVIAGCRLFIGNQSAACALAQGLGKTLVQEVFNQIATSVIPLSNALYWR